MSTALGEYYVWKKALQIWQVQEIRIQVQAQKVVILVAPLIVAGLALGSVYAVGKTVDDYRYWTDYHSNTGHLPRYPFRSGMGDGFKYGSGLTYGYYKVFR